jgi:phage gpG-like protein
VITVEVKGASELQRAFNELAARARDLRPWWPAVARRFWEAERALFDDQGGGKWAPLSPQYQARKLRQYPSTGILERTGDLRRSLTGPSAPGTVYDPQPESLLLGTTVRSAQFHHTGTRKMPARPPIIISESDETAMLKVLVDGFSAFAKNLGFEVK